MVLKLDEKQYNKFKDFDFAELFITSKVDLKVTNKTDGDNNIITSKAVGVKCPICWKIREKKCSRPNCTLN